MTTEHSGPSMTLTQEEWNKAFRISRLFYESVGYDLHTGLRLCPAHAAKLKEMIDKAEMPDWPENPGRLDGIVATPKQD